MEKIYKRGCTNIKNVAVPGLTNIKKWNLASKVKTVLLATGLTLSLSNNIFAQAVLTQTFGYTGAVQMLTLCASEATIECWGAEGGGLPTSGNGDSGDGGKGGYSKGVLSIVSNTTLFVYVGGIGASSIAGPAAGGWNGGGSAYSSDSDEPGNGGGGATDVRVGGQALNNRVIVAGGGGGGGEDDGDDVGTGGGLSGVGYSPWDATQNAAGANGSLGQGAPTIFGDGGGGGGGYYGGGSPQGSSIGDDCEGGGGGSGYIGGVLNGVTIDGNSSMPSYSAVSNVTGNSGNGFVKISYVSAWVPVAVSVSNPVICSGTSAILTASGPGSYTWSTGQTTSTISVSPVVSTTYNVTGSDLVCTSLASTSISVLESPLVSITPLKLSVCLGESVSLISSVANSYTWSTVPPAYTSIVTVTPTLANNSYTVVVANNTNSCTARAVQQITVNPLPVVTISGTTLICKGTPANLTASGADTYEWKSNSTYLPTNPIIIYPDVTTTYSVIGTNSANCKSTTVVVIAVDPCTGIENMNGTTSNVAVYPNPNSGIFTVLLSNGLSKTVDVFDVTGRVVLSNTSTNDLIDANISTLANGVYYVKVKSGNVAEVIKIVKQ